jgi:hypothetical protein
MNQSKNLNYYQKHSRRKNEIGLALQGKASFLNVNASGKFEKEVKQTVRNCDCAVDCTSVGYVFNYYANELKPMLRMAAVFPSKTKTTREILKVTLQDYGIFNLSDGGGQLRILNEPRKQMVDKCAELGSLANLELETMKKEREHVFVSLLPNFLSNYTRRLLF